MTRWSPITVSGGPSAITLPWAITITQSEMSRTMSMSCSTNSTVRPSSRSDFTWPSSDCFSAGFTPAIGSSSMTSSGSAISARAISSSLRWPPESEPAKSSRFLISRNRSSSASARSVLRVLLAAPERREHRLEQALALLPGRADPHVLDDGQPGEHLGQLEGAHHAHPGHPVGGDALEAACR